MLADGHFELLGEPIPEAFLVGSRFWSAASHPPILIDNPNLSIRIVVNYN
jgi:hypothetical protein